VWRRLLVPANVRLHKLHVMLQAAMGWNDSHLHAFRIGDESFGMLDPDGDSPEDEIDETTVTVTQALRKERQFVYEYDFGDGWEHLVVVEEESEQDVPLKFAVCLGGENTCPPDDVGGPEGYEHFRIVLADPDEPEHQDLVDWFGGSFDPASFSLGAVNAELQKVR
jgi:hypothetical protein